MHDTFLITEVKSEWVLEPEEMGSKRKFWYRQPGEQSWRWLFKYPQTGTGQHWAEKLAAEIAEMLGIPSADVGLAVFNGTQGSITKSFMIKDYELVHGNQILSAHVQEYALDKNFQQSDHNLPNIFAALEEVFVEATEQQKAKALFAEYLVLDALVGNTDRHHENWGVLRTRKDDTWSWHPRSITRRRWVESSGTTGANDGSGKPELVPTSRVGGVQSTGRRTKPEAPVPWIARGCFVLRWRRSTDSDVDDLFLRIPDGWMSPFEMKFASEMVHYSIGQLQEVRR